MDPKKLFYDDRLKDFCIFCGGEANTVDHIPSKVFLHKPYPQDLHCVNACVSCNNGFSKDEEYMACFLHCVIKGTTEPEKLTDKRIAKSLKRNEKLRMRIEKSARFVNDDIIWYPDIERIKNVVLKIAIGHIYFELAECIREQPETFEIFPLTMVGYDNLARFENESKSVVSIWPEIGSRAYLRALGELIDTNLVAGWFIVQKGLYRYSVNYYPQLEVKMVFNEYLGCRLVW